MKKSVGLRRKKGEMRKYSIRVRKSTEELDSQTWYPVAWAYCDSRAGTYYVLERNIRVCITEVEDLRIDGE